MKFVTLFNDHPVYNIYIVHGHDKSRKIAQTFMKMNIQYSLRN
jgi:hypothetical protein